MGIRNEVFALIVLMSLAASSAAPSPKFPSGQKWNHTNTEANRLFRSLKKDERGPFLKMELAKGLLSILSPSFDLIHNPVIKIPQDLKIDEKLYQKFQDMPVPNSFHKNLLNWVRDRFHLSYRQIMDICLYEQVCAPDGTCFDTGDVGELCCPF